MDSEGVYLAFEPRKSSDEQIAQLAVYLINYTDLVFSFAYELFLNSESVFKTSNKLTEGSLNQLHEINVEQLNDYPTVVIDFWSDKNEPGRENHLQKMIKIKAQSFFKKIQHTPLLNEETYLFFLFSEFSKVKRVPAVEKKFTGRFHPIPENHEVIRQAHRKNEIDLHVEKLIADYKDMSNAEIVRLQLSRFRQFLERSIAGGVPVIYAIHGVGKGKLREEIHRLLGEYPEVQSFNNNYHPKYGFGATEIFLSL